LAHFDYSDYLRPNKNICLFPVTCPNTKVRVGRSAFLVFVVVVVVVAKGDFAQKLVKHVKTVFSWVIFVKKTKKIC